MSFYTNSTELVQGGYYNPLLQQIFTLLELEFFDLEFYKTHVLLVSQAIEQGGIVTRLEAEEALRRDPGLDYVVVSLTEVARKFGH